MSSLNTCRQTEQLCSCSLSPNRAWLSYSEAREIVGLSRTTLWKLVSSGEIEHRKVGRVVRINRESLEAYMRRDAEGSVT